MSAFTLVCETLEKGGYIMGDAPDGSIYQRNEEECANKACSCGSLYHFQRSYYRGQTGDYVAYAICPRCEHWEKLS